MKKVAVFTAALAMLVGLTPALADTGSLPGGTSISVEIATPVTGAIVPAGPVAVSGTASVGTATAVKNQTIVYVIDVSGSTTGSAGVNCNADPGIDIILVCEKEAVKAVNAAAALTTSPVLNSGVVAFSGNLAGGAAAVDFDPSGVEQLLTVPGPAIASAVDLLMPGGGTSFVAAVTEATRVLTASSASVKTIVFLSDGDDTAGGTLPGAGTLSPSVVRTFAVGSGASCGTGALSLTAVAALGSPTGTCTAVTDLSTLPTLILGQAVVSTLTSLEITVDGGPASPVVAVPALPLPGPVAVSYTTSVTLASGSHTICVTARGADTALGFVTDCNTVQVATVVVDCAVVTPCTATASDRTVSTATFRGTNIFKTVGLRAATTAPNACAGVNCVTAYDVLFPAPGALGRAELFVVTAPAVSTPFWKAAVYIDDVKVTRSCLYNVLTRTEQLPCKIIGPTLKGGTFYYVKFAADPGIKFR